MHPIELKNAPSEVREVFKDIMLTRNVKDVNNFWKYLAHEPRMLGHVWRTLKDLMSPGKLDPLTKQLIYLAVSITNGCTYCQASHSAAARGEGASDEMLNELYAVVGLANMTNQLAIAFQVPVDEAFRRPPPKRARSNRGRAQGGKPRRK